VGINIFKNYPQSTLHGCVNDANDMASVLKAYLGFKTQDITLLSDAQATKQNIMSQLKSMVADARAGKLNYLVFSMSSHGTQVPDTNGDEPDKADEAFCPHDLAQSGNQWDLNHLIVDDELHNLFATLPPNVLLEVYLDTCHAGTGLRALDLMVIASPGSSLRRHTKHLSRSKAGSRAGWRADCTCGRRTSFTTFSGQPAAITRPAPMPTSAGRITALSPTISAKRCVPARITFRGRPC